MMTAFILIPVNVNSYCFQVTVVRLQPCSLQWLKMLSLSYFVDSSSADGLGTCCQKQSFQHQLCGCSSTNWKLSYL